LTNILFVNILSASFSKQPGKPPMDTSTLDLDKMKASAGNACRLMKVLSNPDRLMLLCQLSQGEKRVGELEEILSIVQPTLSQQLTVLRDEELVTTRRDGKSIYYQIASPQALAVMNVLFEQFCGPQTGDNT
jgi:DNA-binding transcriptional ArsR family regulator